MFQKAFFYFDGKDVKIYTRYPTYPYCALFQVAAVVGDTVGMLEAGEEADLLENVLPFLHRLLPVVGHLLDGHNLF